MDHKEAQAEAKAAKAKAKALRPWFKKKRFVVLGAVGLIVVIGIATSGGDSNTASNDPASDSAEVGESDSDATTPETTTQSSDSSVGGTTSQKNAIRAAENYLDTLPFSRSGLIEQLEFEGYSKDDATFAVDSIAVDWNEQAARAAENYLETMPFSRASLIEQLEFEG